jgi:mycothiol synthase
MIDTTPTFSLPLPFAPDLPGLRFRGFQGETDYPKMIAVIKSTIVEDQVERNDTVESMANLYAHLHNCDLSQDLLIAEVDGLAVGYTRVWWEVEADGNWLGWHVGFLHPDWRGKGIGTAMLQFADQRLRSIASLLQGSEHLPDGRPRYFTTTAQSTEKYQIALLETHGYSPVRWEHIMVRPDLENIPEARLPPGLEVRPVLMEHMPAIYQANVEAFRDHWGFVPPGEEDYLEWIGHPEFDPSHYQVAWDGDQVAGMVLASISKSENEEYHRLRGWTEGICVRRPWRRIGLARALLVRSLHDLKASGMQEAALTVDTQNLSSAFRLYESVGFQPVGGFAVYRKAF